MAKNLVLGGSGTLGKAFCKYLDGLDESVINLDLKEGFDLRTMSLDDYKDVDYVWFLAWEVGGAKYLTNQAFQLDMMRSNALLSINVFNFLEKFSKNFAFISSQLATDPQHYYGVTKITGEAMTRLLRGKIVRPWNVYGWEEPNIKSHVVPDLVLQAMQTGKIKLMTDGSEQRQFIYVEDFCKCLFAFKDRAEKHIDLTNGHWISILELAETIGKFIPCEIIPGTISAYKNMVPPDGSHKLFEYPTSLEDGIRKIIILAEKYLQGKRQTA